MGTKRRPEKEEEEERGKEELEEEEEREEKRGLQHCVRPEEEKRSCEGASRAREGRGERKETAEGEERWTSHRWPGGTASSTSSIKISFTDFHN